MALDMAAAASILKERYVYGRVLELGWRKRPLFAILKKDFGAGGEDEKIPVDVASVQASAADFATGQGLAASKATQFGDFKVTCVESYSFARVKGKAIAATRNNQGAFLKAMGKEIDSGFSTILDDTERALLRDGTGIIGVGDGAYTVASTTLTLAHPTQAHCFQLGMEVGATPDAATNPRAGSATVTGMNRTTGELETDSNWSAQITGLNNSDYLIRHGDYLAANDVLKISGLEAWCPKTAPTAGDSHFGQDRSLDVQRLAGIRYDAKGLNIDEALVNMQSEGSANGANPRVCFLHNYNLRNLVNLLGAKKEYGFLPVQGPDGPMADIGFETIRVYGDTGPIDVLGHPLVPYDVAWMFDPDELVLLAMGEFPSIIDDDGMQMLRVYNDNSVEARIGGYPQMATNNPGSIVRGELA